MQSLVHVLITLARAFFNIASLGTNRRIVHDTAVSLDNARREEVLEPRLQASRIFVFSSLASYKVLAALEGKFLLVTRRWPGSSARAFVTARSRAPGPCSWQTSAVPRGRVFPAAEQYFWPWGSERERAVGLAGDAGPSGIAGSMAIGAACPAPRCERWDPTVRRPSRAGPRSPRSGRRDEQTLRCVLLSVWKPGRRNHPQQQPLRRGLCGGSFPSFISSSLLSFTTLQLMILIFFSMFHICLRGDFHLFSFISIISVENSPSSDRPRHPRAAPVSHSPLWLGCGCWAPAGTGGTGGGCGGTSVRCCSHREWELFPPFLSFHLP